MRTSVINIKDAPKGWESDPRYVYVGRKGKGHDGYFGNPVRLLRESERGSTISLFRHYAEARVVSDPEYARRVRGLAGKTLVCFCKPKPCHGDVLAEMSSVLEEGR